VRATSRAALIAGLRTAILVSALAQLSFGCSGPGDPAGIGTMSDSGSREIGGSTGLSFRVRTDPGLEGVAGRILEDPMATSAFPGLGLPGVWIRDTVELILVRDLSTLEEEGIGTPERWVAGLADPPSGRIALRAGTELETLGSLRTVFRHELAHLVVDAASAGNAPRWLHEGYAQFASGAWGFDDAWRIQLALFRGGSSTLAAVDLRFRSNSEDVRTAYLLAYTVVQELHALGGDAGISAFFGQLRQGDSPDVALRRVYGITQEQFERRWRSMVMDRYGWLYLLTRAALFWLLITVFVFVVGVRRVRRDRRRLEEMREEERISALEQVHSVDYELFEG
jgi:hypothetical protein